MSTGLVFDCGSANAAVCAAAATIGVCAYTAPSTCTCNDPDNNTDAAQCPVDTSKLTCELVGQLGFG